MALRLIFIGYNEHLTQLYLREFEEVNRRQVLGYDPVHGKIWLRDGAIICKTPNSINRLDGLRFDQVIVACDSRGTRHWPRQRRELLRALINRASWSSQVREEDIVIIYELDEREGSV